jgi:hypothetical protein
VEEQIMPVLEELGAGLCNNTRVVKGRLSIVEMDESEGSCA